MSSNIQHQSSQQQSSVEVNKGGQQFARQLPQIPPNSTGNYTASVSTPPPPQPPQRSNLRSTIVRTNSNTSGTENATRILTSAQTPTGVWSLGKSLNQHENASSEAAKLVHKSAMAGSIHSLNKPNLVAVAESPPQSQVNADLNAKQHQRKFSVRNNFTSLHKI